MNNLCCKLNPEFLCQECGMRICTTCYAKLVPDRSKEATRKWIAVVEYHEEGSCPEGADTWLSQGSDGPMIFGKHPK